jgi:hypothetical protein
MVETISAIKEIPLTVAILKDAKAAAKSLGYRTNIAVETPRMGRKPTFE